MSELPLEILGRYKILRVIGRGAMGIVYEAIDPEIDRVVAIKTINLTLSPEEMVKYEARFKQEIKAAGRLNHPNIVTIYDVGKTDNFAYMAMEFINGCELKDLLKSGTALPVDVALDIVSQAAEGLAFAHSREIIHRDVKPANIMLLENEDGLIAKITDFGIARMPASAVKTMTGMVMGSPRYMSPEQVVGKNLSARSDIFSLGVVLYEALTGTAPFEADSISSIMYQTVHAIELPPSNVNPNLDPELDAIVAKALAKSPEDRFDTMKAFSRRLREVLRERTGGTAFALTQLRTSTGMPAASVPSPIAATAAAEAPGERTLPLAGADEFDGTRLAPAWSGTTPESSKAAQVTQRGSTPLPAGTPRGVADNTAAASVPPAPMETTGTAGLDAPHATTPVRLPVSPKPAPQESGGERTSWPVAVDNQFDSTIATLRLAEITAQMGELSEFISASRQMAALKEEPSPPAETPAIKPARAINRIAAITLTLDPLPEPRKIPMAPMLLIGGLGSTVLILLVALVATF